MISLAFAMCISCKAGMTLLLSGDILLLPYKILEILVTFFFQISPKNGGHEKMFVI